ncbi:MAG: bshC, partial [Chitinophagaceae bacterium]|nr:bshC [Chitinophagaceae bacterium]
MHAHPIIPVSKAEAVRLPYRDTGHFQGIVTDYLDSDPKLAAFYTYQPDVAGFKKAIEDRRSYAYPREQLLDALEKQYESLDAPEGVKRNLQLLRNSNCFTITTAHQPNVFTGPLYFVYKILHTIQLTEWAKRSQPDFDFVPVFFMGSEDADLDELGHFTVEGKRYQWKTKQSGAVGRMKVDKAFLQLITELEGQVAVHPFGAELVTLLHKAYREGASIQDCTLRLVNALFGAYGLVVLIPDDPALKQLFQRVASKELKEQFSHRAVATTVADLGKTYKVQAGGRELNLFYLLNDQRERLELQNGKYKVPALGLEFTPAEILAELEQHPERFSPNVILRGVFQEMILPNVAFIGGGGEIAYWLELKNVFRQAEVPYPVLVLRNSFLVINEEQRSRLDALGFGIPDIFKNTNDLLNDYVRRESFNKISLSEEKGELNSFYQQLHESVLATDVSLAEHVNALQA